MTIEINRPELEALIRKRIDSGVYQNVEDLLMQALTSSSPKGQSDASDSHKKKPNLAKFLLDSPLRDSGLNLERRRDYPRPIDL